MNPPVTCKSVSPTLRALRGITGAVMLINHRSKKEALNRKGTAKTGIGKGHMNLAKNYCLELNR